MSGNPTTFRLPTMPQMPQVPSYASSYMNSINYKPNPVKQGSSSYYMLYILLGICCGCCTIMMFNLIFFTYAGWPADTEEGLQITGVVIGSLCCTSILLYIMFSWNSSQEIEMDNL